MVIYPTRRLREQYRKLWELRVRASAVGNGCLMEREKGQNCCTLKHVTWEVEHSVMESWELCLLQRKTTFGGSSRGDVFELSENEIFWITWRVKSIIDFFSCRTSKTLITLIQSCMVNITLFQFSDYFLILTVIVTTKLLSWSLLAWHITVCLSKPLLNYHSWVAWFVNCIARFYLVLVQQQCSVIWWSDVLSCHFCQYLTFFVTYYD